MVGKASEELWDKFETLNQKVTQGLQVSKDFAEYFKKRAQVDDEYSKKVAALCKGPPGGSFFAKDPAIAQETKTMKEGLLSTQHAGLLVSGRFSEIVAIVDAEIVKPLDNFVKAKENERKKLFMDGQKIVKGVADAKAISQKAKDNYFKLSREYEAAREALEKIPSSEAKKIQQGETKVSQAQGKAEQAEQAYRKAVEKANETQRESFTSSLPPILEGFQKIEEERFEETKRVLDVYLGVQKSLPEKFQEANDNMEKVIVPNYEDDWEEFVNNNKPEKDQPDQLEFEPFEGKYTVVQEKKEEVAVVAAAPREEINEPASPQKVAKDEEDLFGGDEEVNLN